MEINAQSHLTATASDTHSFSVNKFSKVNFQIFFQPMQGLNYFGKNELVRTLKLAAQN